VNVLPVGGATTDIGVGVGGFAGATRVRQGYEPYVWNLESAGLVSFKPSEGSGIFVPYQDIYVQPRRPVPTRRLARKGARTRARASVSFYLDVDPERGAGHVEPIHVTA
jgi:hypothetical protein